MIIKSIKYSTLFLHLQKFLQIYLIYVNILPLTKIALNPYYNWLKGQKEQNLVKVL